MTIHIELDPFFPQRTKYTIALMSLKIFPNLYLEKILVLLKSIKQETPLGFSPLN